MAVFEIYLEIETEFDRLHVFFNILGAISNERFEFGDRNVSFPWTLTGRRVYGDTILFHVVFNDDYLVVSSSLHRILTTRFTDAGRFLLACVCVCLIWICRLIR